MLAFVMSCCTCACRSPSLGFGKGADEVTVIANNEWFCLLKCSASLCLSHVTYVLTEMYN